jgi:N-acetylmuramoyl-L-alanine amidase
MRVRRLTTPNQRHGREGRRPRGIVLHTTAGSFDSAVNWFSRPESGVSAHYLVGLDGRVAQFVEEEDTARHAGRVSNPTASLYDGTDPNLYTVGIEFEDGGEPERVRRPDAQYDTGAALIAAIAGRWRIPLDRKHVVGHRELTDRKTCPGNLDLDALVERAASL